MSAALLGPCGILMMISFGADSDPTEEQSAMKSEDVVTRVAAKKRTVVTFVGYSGAGYEDHQIVERTARRVLAGLSPKTTIVSCGATVDGIGAVYGVAKELGFETIGIVSEQARVHRAKISKDVDVVFFVSDRTWGGLGPDGKSLNPTSEAVVQSSDVMIGIGGGTIAREELRAARARSKTVRFIPADLNHERAIAKAKRDGLPAPTRFQGAAYELFGPRSLRQFREKRIRAPRAGGGQ